MKKPSVDAVITWVDGFDKQHQEKLNHYLTKHGIKRPETAASTRYNQCGEIEYCVRSILQFAPWIRTIYIVTDAQTPPILQELAGPTYASKVQLIDHREIFAGYTHCLPTFNSITIESMLWRIPNLSEQFIYFNDDVMLIRPVDYEEFFQDDRIIMRGKWKLASNSPLYAAYKHALKLFGKSNSENLHRIVQENSAKASGINNWFFHLPHIPFPLKKSTFSNFFFKNPEYLTDNIQFPLRSAQQFLPISLACHLEIVLKTARIEKATQAIGVDASRHPLLAIINKLKKAETDARIKFVCMQGIDMASLETRNFMLEWLNKWTVNS